jgi:molybdate transport system substrate-binding protein
MHSPLPAQDPGSGLPKALSFSTTSLRSVGLITNLPRELYMRLRNLWITFAVAFAFTIPTCKAQEITVAAAADLQFAFQDVAARFQKETGKSVKLISGSSGNFFTQIQNGAPFDIFFSADIDYPKKLEAAELAEPGTLFQYATGKIVLWVPNESKLDLGRGLSVLLDPSIKKIALANPEHAPYGRAAVAAIKHENIYDKISDKFVLGENISQAAYFVASGSADIGIVALSLALAPSLKQKGRYAEISADAYPPLEQGAVILKSSQKKDTARQFIEFLKTPPILELLRSYGFSVPGSPAAR